MAIYDLMRSRRARTVIPARLLRVQDSGLRHGSRVQGVGLRLQSGCCCCVLKQMVLLVESNQLGVGLRV